MTHPSPPLRQLSTLLGSVLVLVLSAAPASAQTPEAPSEDDSARDDAIFSDDDEPSADGSSRDDDIFGAVDDDDTGESSAADSDGPGSEDERRGLLMDTAAMFANLDEVDDYLQIGGMLYMRMDWQSLERGGVEDFPLSSPNLLDLYLDARPSDHIRAYIRGRLHQDFSIAEDATDALGQPVSSSTLSLDQLWLKFDIANRVFFTVGRQPIRWGTGRFWNPTDFMNRSFKDPVAVFDERTGVDMIKVHVPVESLGWNFYALLDFDGADSLDDLGGAFRGEFLVGNTEIAVSAAGRKDTPWRLGTSISTALWWFDVGAEFALVQGGPAPRWEGEFDISSGESLKCFLTEEAQSCPTPRDISDKWWPRLALSAEIAIPYGDDDSVYVGAEYSFNGLGYDDPDLYPWLATQQDGSFTPFYLGYHYAGIYASLPGPGTLDDTVWTLSTLGNLTDLSFLSRFDFSAKVLTYLTVNAYVSVQYGATGELNYGVPRVSMTDEAADDIADPGSLERLVLDVLRPSLANGQARPLIGAGIGLRLAL